MRSWKRASRRSSVWSDLWKFQLKEIREANPTAGEDQKLESEKRVLANSERVYGAAMGAFDVLYEVEESAIARLGAATKHLEELSRFDESFKESLGQLESARITVEDVATTLRDFADGMDASPERLAEVEDRLAILDKLRRKYGKTLEDVLAFRAGYCRTSSTKSKTRTNCWPLCARSWLRAAAKYLDEARSLSKRRYEMARKLEKTVEGEINDLAMKAKFKIEVSGSDEEGNWSASGFDQVAYLISTNPGEPMGPIEEIASGGELSRVMLALKASVEAGRLHSQELGCTALPGIRRNRCGDRWARGRCSGQEVEGAIENQAGSLHHPPAADCILCRPAFPDREARERRAGRRRRSGR